MTEGNGPVVIVGAGVAGLSCAQALAAAGRAAVVLDRARGVGGRCATRRLDGQPVDFGVAFLHGRAPGFVAALQAVDAPRVPGWPRDVLGSGRPCQPEAFGPGEHRVAFAEGVTAFPKHLARGLDVRLGVKVTGLAAAEGRLRVALEPGGAVVARDAVLALPGEQVEALLGTLPGDEAAVRSARALLETARSHPCLALMAVYPADAPAPSWHACYPEDSRIIQVVANDASKRPPGAAPALVLQAHAAWSHQHLEDPAWPDALLAEAARLLGPWAARPRVREPHRWRWARVDRAAELAGPMLLRLAGGARLGIAGERFAPGGGVEAAWTSGRELARRMLAEEEG